MKNRILYVLMISAAVFFAACEKPVPPEPEHNDPEPEPGFVESVPDTTVFDNADFIYYGDASGEEVSDEWVIKLYTDMYIDELGNPVGPGAVMQLMLNVKYDQNQGADPEMLAGRYTEMLNSGNYAPGTFVWGYMTTIDLPGLRLELADATFYADVADGSTEMDYDLLDEGALVITSAGDGMYRIEGVMVGDKCTKRYFTWSGKIEPRNNVPEEVPNSTLKHDLMDISFVKGAVQDKGDCFYRMDNTYRSLVLYLAEESVDMSASRPAGNGAVLRLEFLVPWDVDVVEDGMPEGTFVMVDRNPDTSIDKDKIVPGSAVPGLPNVFAAWKVSGTWYYELEGGVWTDIYARIDEGEITLEKAEDGSYVVKYDLKDCQGYPRRITGQTLLDVIPVI